MAHCPELLCLIYNWDTDDYAKFGKVFSYAAILSVSSQLKWPQETYKTSGSHTAPQIGNFMMQGDMQFLHWCFFKNTAHKTNLISITIEFPPLDFPGLLPSFKSKVWLKIIVEVIKGFLVLKKTAYQHYPSLVTINSPVYSSSLSTSLVSPSFFLRSLLLLLCSFYHILCPFFISLLASCLAFCCFTFGHILS